MLDPSRIAASYVRQAAVVHTNTATIYALAPDQLRKLLQEGQWSMLADDIWPPDGERDPADPTKEMNQLIRFHGGSVFFIGRDGYYDVNVPQAKVEYGYLNPHHRVRRVASAHEAATVRRRVGAQLLVAEATGDVTTGEGPEVLLVDVLDLVDLEYRDLYGRAATKEEVVSVLRSFALGVEENENDTWPRNLWVDAVKEAFEVTDEVVLALPEEDIDALRELWDEFVEADAYHEKAPDYPTPLAEGAPPLPDVALDRFYDRAEEALVDAKEDGELFVEGVPDKLASRSRNPRHLVMFDFDGTLFNSEERSPEWWTKPGQFSWGADPRSLEPPCVPERPQGSRFWNMKAVQAAKEASSDPDTHLVVITGRVPVHEERIAELLAQQGIRPDAIYTNVPAGSAATFKKRVFGVLLIKFPTIVSLDIWENENNDVYGAFVTAMAERLDRDIELEVHRISEKHVPAECGPADFPGEMRVAASRTTGDGSSVGLFLPLPASLASQFPSLGAEDPSPPHVTLLYVGKVPAEKEELFVATVLSVLSRQPGPIVGTLSEPDFFVHPEKDQRVWYSRVHFSKDVAEVRDRLWLALEDAGFDVQHSFPLAFFPHATLAYEPDAHSHAPWKGPVPRGSWEISSVAVWGLREPYDVMLGTFEPQSFTEVATPRSMMSRVASRWLAALAGGSVVYHHEKNERSSFGGQSVGFYVWRKGLLPGDGPTFLYSRTWSINRYGERHDVAVDGPKTYFTKGDKAFTPAEFDKAFARGRLPDSVLRRVLSQPRFQGAEEVGDVDFARTAKDRIPGGLGDKKEPHDFDAVQLDKGVEVELEHTDDREVAREIAMDHLTEDPGYYDKLEEVEREARLVQPRPPSA